MSDLTQTTSGDGVKLQGFIDLELVSTVDNVRRVYHNTITNAGKQLLLAKSVGNILCNTGSIFGDVIVADCLGGDITYSNDDNRGIISKYCSNKYQLSNVLLYLNDTIASLSESTTFLNMKNADFSTGAKLMGYANSSVIPLSDGKEGLLDYQKGEYTADPYTRTNRWKYDVGVATGTIDTIAMMPAASFKDDTVEGFRFMKCLDRVSCQYNNYVSKSTGFCPPGIVGLTGNDEILLNFSQDNVSRWKYNLSTGEMTEVSTADPFVCFTGNTTDVYSDGTYTYVLRINSIANIDGYLYMDVYLQSTGALITTLTLSKGSIDYPSYFVSAKFLIKNSILYAVTMSTKDRSTGSDVYNRYGHKVVKLSKGAKAYWSEIASQYKTFADSDLGLTIPTTWDENYIGIGTYGTQYVLYTLCSDSTNGYPITAWIIPTLDNIIGTAVTGAYYFLRPNSVLFVSSAYSGALQIGDNYYQQYVGNTSNPLVTLNNRAQDRRYITNNDGTLNLINSETGVYISLEAWNSNVMSFVKLATPIVKQDTDILYVSYGYKIV